MVFSLDIGFSRLSERMRHWIQAPGWRLTYHSVSSLQVIEELEFRFLVGSSPCIRAP